MKFVLSEHLMVQSGATTYTPAVEMVGANAVYVAAATLAGSALGVKITLEESNDLENWSASIEGSSVDLGASVRYNAGKWTGVASRYVRAKLTATGTAFVAVDVETSPQ